MYSVLAARLVAVNLNDSCVVASMDPNILPISNSHHWGSSGWSSVLSSSCIQLIPSLCIQVAYHHDFSNADLKDCPVGNNCTICNLILNGVIVVLANIWCAVGGISVTSPYFPNCAATNRTVSTGACMGAVMTRQSFVEKAKRKRKDLIPKSQTEACVCIFCYT